MPALDYAVCPNMKAITLRTVYLSLRDEKYPIKVPKSIASRAREALTNMFEFVGES